MNLAEVLVYADIGQLHQIASHYGYEGNLHSKNELITTLMTRLRHSQTITHEVEQLSSVDTHFLLLLFLDKRDRLTLEDLLAKASMALPDGEEQKKEAARKQVAIAIKRGWLFPAKGNLIGQYQIPADLREPYIQAWLTLWRGQQEPIPYEPLAYRDEGTAMCDDIMLFLQFLAKEPVPLTADGGMYKRYQVQLLEFLSVKEEPLPPQKWRFGYGLHFDLYPDRFSLLYDFCYYHRWIEEISGRLEITESGAERFAETYTDQTYHDLVRFWMRLYKRAIPNLPLLTQLIPRMATSRWISQERLSQTLLPWIKPFYYDKPEDILVTRILKMMVHLGLLKAGQAEDGDWLYTGTYASQSWMKQYNGFVDTTITMK
ncbi:hypothetical protein [Brevibacillus dissolubilis]|uniref:hypothetical protein n=1 Tax=Brevibacillus dissolubilis TaxID=1844116 RepID=UPI0011163C2F|nr:hypothetical protein [Brevibacillus dissolubilis]